MDTESVQLILECPFLGSNLDTLAHLTLDTLRSIPTPCSLGRWLSPTHCIARCDPSRPPLPELAGMVRGALGIDPVPAESIRLSGAQPAILAIRVFSKQVMKKRRSSCTRLSQERTGCVPLVRQMRSPTSEWLLKVSSALSSIGRHPRLIDAA